MFAAHTLGAEGERIAVEYLRQKDYEILHTNCRIGREEIDIVARDHTDHMLVFVEVKTRSRLSASYPVRTALTRRKRAALRRAMFQWMERMHTDEAARIDLVVVSQNRVTEHLQDLGSEFLI